MFIRLKLWLEFFVIVQANVMFLVCRSRFESMLKSLVSSNSLTSFLSLLEALF